MSPVRMSPSQAQASTDLGNKSKRWWTPSAM
eukprot:CAMPEP_0182590660 /NCGR_PEP_ID=MMETSP1324-20130603/72095_1 /TAXON_ID=236786 /ORGANISM="Florenciella sp., Strain RCC1587" /LENGTH=30 /DNA_ID= /DNA_START= /DNA_END= /DNA_ORIENTATION=